MILIQDDVSSFGVSIYPQGRSAGVSSSHRDRSPGEREGKRRRHVVRNTVGSFSIASMENLQRPAAEDARLEGGALPAQAARRAVRRGAAAAEDGTAAEYPEAAAAEELRLRREDGAGGEEAEEGQQGGAHLDLGPSKVSCHLS